jgi:hypothetical protein
MADDSGKACNQTMTRVADDEPDSSQLIERAPMERVSRRSISTL